VYGDGREVAIGIRRLLEELGINAGELAERAEACTACGPDAVRVGLLGVSTDRVRLIRFNPAGTELGILAQRHSGAPGAPSATGHHLC
jgi:hypothetical protein